MNRLAKQSYYLATRAKTNKLGGFQDLRNEDSQAAVCSWSMILA